MVASVPTKSAIPLQVVHNRSGESDDGVYELISANDKRENGFVGRKWLPVRALEPVERENRP